MNELLGILNREGIRYVLIGGQAMRLFGMPRFSMDWDLFLPPRDDANFLRLNRVLGAELGEEILPLGPMGENFVQTIQTRWGILQFHLGVPGLPRFEEVERRAVAKSTEDGLRVTCVCGRDLLASKEAAGRPQDQQDLEYLRELARLGRLE